MPGAYHRTSTLTLTNATMPYIEKLANLGAKAYFTESISIQTALNTHKGKLTNEAVAIAHGLSYTFLDSQSF